MENETKDRAAEPKPAPGTKFVSYPNLDNLKFQLI